jgi:hypothetical protein
MTIRDKQLLAWLDGELDEAGAEEVEQAVQADPALMARAETHFLTMMQLRGAFAPLLEAPFPDFPLASERAQKDDADSGADDVVASEPVASADSEPPSRRGIWRHVAGVSQPGIPPWLVLAAVLVIGMLIGRFAPGTAPPSVAGRSAVLSPAQGDIVRDQDGALIAAGTLADTLENGLAPGDTEPVRIPLSFRDKTGKLCRSFDTARLAGIACRDDDGWRLRLALQTSSGARSAASESPFIGQAVDAMIAGEPLDAGQQQAAKDRGWR